MNKAKISAHLSYILMALQLVALSYSMAWGQERPGSTAAPILQVPIDARSVGMGTAFTSIGGDLNSLHYNPAGIAPMLDRETTFMYLKGFEDQSVENVAFASPLPLRGLSGGGYATLAVSALFSQNGSINVNQTNPDGSFLGSRTVSAGNDVVGTMAYAEKIADTSIETSFGSFKIDHYAGVSGKLIHSTLADQYSAEAFAADIGYLVKDAGKKWAAGASLLNLGSQMKFVSAGDPLPLTFRAGASHQIIRPSVFGLTLAADGEYLFYDRQWHVNTGVEYSPLPWAAARIGYQFNRDVAGLTIGFGVQWADFALDYAWAMSDALTDTHRFSITYRFDHMRAEDREGSQRSWGETAPRREPSSGRQRVRPSETAPQSPNPPVRENGQGAPEWIY